MIYAEKENPSEEVFLELLENSKNVVFHREHRSKRNRSKSKVGILQKHKRSSRRKWKQLQNSSNFLLTLEGKRPKKHNC